MTPPVTTTVQITNMSRDSGCSVLSSRSMSNVVKGNSSLDFVLCAIDDLGYVQYVISVMPIVSCNMFEEPLVGLKYDPPNRPGASFDCTRYSIQAFGRTLAEGPGEQAHEYMEEWRQQTGLVTVLKLLRVRLGLRRRRQASI